MYIFECLHRSGQHFTPWDSKRQQNTTVLFSLDSVSFRKINATVTVKRKLQLFIRHCISCRKIRRMQEMSIWASPCFVLAVWFIRHLVSRCFWNFVAFAWQMRWLFQVPALILNQEYWMLFIGTQICSKNMKKRKVAPCSCHNWSWQIFRKGINHCNRRPTAKFYCEREFICRWTGFSLTREL